MLVTGQCSFILSLNTRGDMGLSAHIWFLSTSELHLLSMQGAVTVNGDLLPPGQYSHKDL